MALGRIRAGNIDDIGAPTTAAIKCNLYYEPSRDFVLADFPWNFAKKTLSLGKLSEVPVEWTFQYTYPADALNMRYLLAASTLRQHNDPTEWEIMLSTDGSQVIATDLDAACVAYTVKQENVNLFSAHFVTALSWYLAGEVAIPIAGTSKGRILRDDAMKGYINFMDAAIAANASEGETGKRRDPELIRAHQ